MTKDMNILVEKSLTEHMQLLQKVMNNEELVETISQIIERVVATYRAGGQLLLCGNGGSAADAQHLSTELVSRFYMERKALNAEALTVNTSTLTAIANDYDYSRIFARQVEAKAKSGDVLLGITTSGSSKNIIEAFKTAKAKEVVTIAFTGEKNEMIKEYSDYLISVPSIITPRIQEMHILIGHIICEGVEEKMFGDDLNEE